MVLDRERDIIKLLISQTLGAFCKSHLAYSSQITIDGLVGVTIDQSDVILVTIKESLKLTDKTLDNSMTVENFSAETPNAPIQNDHFNDGNHSDENIKLKYVTPLQSFESVSDDPVRLQDAIIKESHTQVLDNPSDYGLDLSLHNRSSITVIEPSNMKGELSGSAAGVDEMPAPWQELKENTFSLGGECSYQTLVEKSNLQSLLSTKSTSKHLILPLFTTYRANLKKRKIQLLSKFSPKKPLVVDGDCGPSALQNNDMDVKVKLEHSSPGPDWTATPTDLNPGKSSYQDPVEVTEYDSSSTNENVRGSSRLGSLNDRWVGSDQLPWADFQNMLIRSWRRNLHEEMLLKPSAHALIESWTNLSDAMSHKRISECVQAILLYEGRYVPVRDIQRLRLSSMTSQEIRSTMEFLNSTREGKVGCYREIRGGIGVFYKCPPHLVDVEFLESFGLSVAIYETRYNSRMVSNATNRHSAVYWYRIETCSPYLSSTEVL